MYYHVTHSPALLGRSHAYLTGMLLALTLPPFTPWYVVVLASAFAILLGKAIFGGVGHFLWQPALVGRFAVAVVAPALFGAGSIEPAQWGLLDGANLIFGDITRTHRVEHYRGWSEHELPPSADAYGLAHPAMTLATLTRPSEPAFSALAEVRQTIPQRKPTALTQLPPINDMILGARPGGIGETSVLMIILGGMYLIYRNYVKWPLPATMLLAAGAVAAIAPIQLAGPNDTTETVWVPLLSEGLDVGLTYVACQLFTGAFLLAAFFLAPEMTSSPVTTGGQVIFAVGCGAIGMVMKLYLNTQIPVYVAVLVMNTFVPTIDAIWRPRVFGQRRFGRKR
jgi:electron transport complex protein RnfD